MIRNGTWHGWKKWTGIALGVLLAADLGLAYLLWNTSREVPATMRLQRNRLEAQAKLLSADVERGEKIRASLPQAGKDCDAFYQGTLLDASSGYSRIESDLAVIASKAGVRTSGLSFKQKEVKDRGVTQISITTSVDADYPAVVAFINGLERSKNFYLLDSLHLASATAGGLRLDLELHTYFRT
jgi:hypothetical protein